MMGAKVVKFLLVLGLTGFLGSAAAAQTVVKVGDIGIPSDAPFYIGMEKGYYRERGIELKLVRFAGAAAMMGPLAAGELDVAGGAVNPGLFNGFARGMPIKVVAGRSRAVPGLDADILMVRSDLKEGVRRPADLKGMKVAVNTRGSVLEFMLGKVLESDGLSLKDVEVVYMPWPDMGPAFANKAIHAGTLVEPFATWFQDKGHAFIWKTASDVVKNPYLEVAVLFYNKDWAAKNPKLARDFMVAYIRAARELLEAMTGGKNRTQVVDILLKYTPLKDRTLYDRIVWADYIDPNGEVSRESLRQQQDWWATQGLVPQKVDVERILDDGYVRYALAELGRHPGK